MTIRPITIDDAKSYWELRLRALKEHPEAFGSSYEESCKKTADEVKQRMQNTPENFILGVFDTEEKLIGMAGFLRESHSKMKHKGSIWGMYVIKEEAGKGLAKKLLEDVLIRIRLINGLERVNLCVVVTNDRARKLYHGFGFVPYGLERHALKIGETYYDEEMMTLEL